MRDKAVSEVAEILFPMLNGWCSLGANNPVPRRRRNPAGGLGSKSTFVRSQMCSRHL
jgi:hypothetical protein